MATIKTGRGTGVLAVLVVDTPILDTPDRIAVSACSLHNTNTVDVTVSVYISPDLTSASGALADVISLAANQTLDVGGIIGQGYSSTQNIVMAGDLTGVNATLTYTQYSGASI